MGSVTKRLLSNKKVLNPLKKNEKQHKSNKVEPNKQGMVCTEHELIKTEQGQREPRKHTILNSYRDKHKPVAKNNTNNLPIEKQPEFERKGKRTQTRYKEKLDKLALWFFTRSIVIPVEKSSICWLGMFWSMAAGLSWSLA